VPTPIVGSGSNRSLGFALGPPATPPGTVVYRQTTLGKLGPPRSVDTKPFGEVRVAVYNGLTPQTSAAVISTAPALPLRGRVVSKRLNAGADDWLLQVRAVHPLVGATTAAAPWFVLGAGLLLCAFVTATAEVESRRRANAIALYRNEHRLAEGLQRSLLPDLPIVAGLDIAARYLPGTEGLQVGGDWYDVFTLDEGRIGVVIGDVVGHDISASATMSRVQAALRAYAFRIADPAVVLDRLDMLIETFQSERLVTMFYGVLGPADSSGAREFWYANAGHPPPLACRPGGGVDELDGGASMLLGVAAGPEGSRSSARIRLPAGSTLMLFTDGLVEVPGESLTDSLARLKASAAKCGEVPPDELCDRLVAGLPDTELRDDVAIIALRLADLSAPQAGAPDATDGVLRHQAAATAQAMQHSGAQAAAPDQVG
jgi:serine phosphatase RsbU (regulator of sigma subunit)